MVTAVKEYYKKINLNILKLTEKKYFNEIYAGLIAVITVFGWKFQSTLGMILMILMAAVALILTKDLKYIIPHVIYFIFMINEGFSNSEMPIPILLLGGAFVILILFFSFRNGIHLKKMHCLYGLLGLAIINILPIFWCRTVPKGNEVFYFFFFGNLGYFILYCIMVNGIKKDSIHLLAVSMSYLALILTAECSLIVLSKRHEVSNILKLWYYMGWGLCNEAGIMICVSLPFIFYLMGNEEKAGGILFQNLKIILSIVGLILTTSRGSYLFGFLEIGILYVILLFKAKNARVYQNLFFIYGVLILIGMVCFKDQVIKLVENVMKLVFTEHLDDNGRKELWGIAYRHWNSSPLTRILGPGIICELREGSITASGVQLTPVVFHSTFFETLAAGGIAGIVFLIFHFIQKYWNLWKCNKLFFLTVGIGLFIVDIYGMIDNTYHMYYFMIPLMVILAVIDASLSEKGNTSVTIQE